MRDYKWPVVPLCERQLRDVNPSDVLKDGLYRRCNIYKGGGGYDKFEAIYKSRFGGSKPLNEQFVVQLQGCPLRCQYCYVTQDGILGKPTPVPTSQLMADFRETGYPVFHLMGGAPALYLHHWPEIGKQLNGAVFHSDFLLCEGLYDYQDLQRIADIPNSLHAVSIKGCDEGEYVANTGVHIPMSLIIENLDLLVETEVPFYITFTGMSEESIAKFKKMVEPRYKEDVFKDSFAIQVIHYNALD